jgi:hypothetical protein
MTTTESTPSTPVDPSTLVPLEERCEWTSDRIGDDYVFRLSDEHLAEIDAALAHAERRTDEVLDVTRDDFPLPTLGPELSAITRELIDGRGVVQIKGVPVEAYGKDRSTTVYWGIGAHLGHPWPQNHKGHLLGDVTDQGKGYDDPTSRGNEIGGVPFPFHSDGSDLVGLFCLNPGLSGGASLVANVVSIHNEMVRSAPELAAELYGMYPYDLRGEQKPGSKGWYLTPICTRQGDRLFVRYIRPYISSARRHPDAPPLTARQKEALDRVDAMCADPTYHVSMTLEPGDMQFVNNYHVLHARTGYTDDREAGKVRHLKRLWLQTDLLGDDDKPERFRLGGTSGWWSTKGRTKSEL